VTDRAHLASAGRLAAAVRAREVSASDIAAAALARIDAQDGWTGAYTDITRARALADAAAVDAVLAAGGDPGPLAGVPFAAKNLFDIEGVVTRAGSLIERERPPAAADAWCVAQLRAAGAVCLGALNMDEYAYGFTTENPHDGPVRNPHDTKTARSAGGSSGGSGAALAAGLATLTLGTDTNGSIRVPASVCGVWGLKPTYGRVSRSGCFPFVASLDHVGPLARGVADLALAYNALLGRDPADPAQSDRPALPVTLDPDWRGARVARLGGHFAANGRPEAQAAADAVAQALGATEVVDLPDAEAARAAAFLVTGAEGGALHLPSLRTRPDDFGPLARDRLRAGAMIPAAWVVQAQKLRRFFHAQALAAFSAHDILVAPATPACAQPIGTEWLEVAGGRVKLRPSFGVYTQPISCIGLPVIAAPVLPAAGSLPIGVQLIAAPWNENLLFQAAAALERAGICAAPVASAYA
jgi:amidase/aspartyl-tRNA(Asn)/glutamyl-tRNA(Gln) amidotransferase subunit A